MNIIFFIFASLLIFGLVLLAGGTLIGYWFQKKREYFVKTMKDLLNYAELAANLIDKKPDKDG